MPFWRSPRIIFTLLFLLFCTVILSQSVRAEAVEIIIVGDSIPNSYSIYPYRTYLNSDTLFLNQRRLQRSIDYRFNDSRGLFDLTSVQAGELDTLKIIYHKIPSWLRSRFGRSIPSLGKPELQQRGHNDYRESDAFEQPRSALQFSGAKSFRFSSRSQGNSEFGQTLDLKLSGELTPGVTLSGSISDRGYEPAYGVANSRLNELEKVQLSLTSKRFQAMLGDFTSLGLTEYTARPKRVSGVKFALKNDNYQVDGLIARPKGTYATAQFVGIDQQQGPYQITAAGNPIVPGSETVWLDGIKLERGGSKDYTMDYPVGRITFTEKNRIDARSRLEFDYELQTTSYRGELFSGSASAYATDSSLLLNLGWTREGDDRNQPLVGELSQQDIDLLSSVGDSVDKAVRVAVVPDTAGSYSLVLDSLPDSVFVYVGPDSGDYSVSFRFVGTGRGDYRFIGNSIYQFAGRGNGDYLPERRIEAPQRIDQYYTQFKMRSSSLGELTTEYRQSVTDKNLLSILDDTDNNGSLIQADYKRRFGNKARSGLVHLSGRLRQEQFATRSRINQADFGRLFFLPTDFVGNSDETRYKADLTLPLPGKIMLSPSVERLSYKGELSSVISKFVFDFPLLSNLQLKSIGYLIETQIDSSQVDREGTQRRLQTTLRWLPRKGITATLSAESDSRVHDYNGIEIGTRYNEFKAELMSSSEQVSVEHYVEDSLTVDWSQSLRRTRASFSSAHKYGRFSYTSSLSQEWVLSETGKDRNFMGRLTWSFRNPKSRFNINTSYNLARENRNARGVNYLRVEPGEGNYLLVDSQYVPDTDGDFVQVDELLSEIQSVNRGSKTFTLSKTWASSYFSFNSVIEEELLEQGNRSALWVVPFLSDESQAYLFFNRSYQSEIRLLPIATSYAINLRLRENKEIRRVIDQNRSKTNRDATLTLRQVPGLYRIEQSIELFAATRDVYFTGGGDISGFTLAGTLRRLFGESDMRMRLGYRQANSSDNEQSDQVSVILDGRLAVVRLGILEPRLEVYKQTLSNVGTSTSYLLTDNRPGELGAIWSLSARIGLKKQMRLNLTVSGRHSDNRAGRILGRGEVVAKF